MNGRRAQDGGQPLSWLVRLTSYWLGLNIVWGALTTVVLPYLVGQRVDPDVKSSAVALIAAAQAVVGIIIQPFSGALSDRLVTRWGRRRPWMVVGVTCQVVALASLTFAPGYWSILLIMVGVELASNTAQGPYQGLLPDLLPPGSRGAASGLMGAAQLGGQILGAAFAGVAIAVGAVGPAIWLAAASVALGAVVTIQGIAEPRRIPARGTEPPRTSRNDTSPGLLATARAALGGVWGRDLLGRRDFLWLLGARLAILMAAGTLQPFILFYLQDSLHLGDAAGPLVAPIAGTVALAALVAAIPGGTLTARYGRVRVVAGSALVGAVGAAAFSVAPAYLWLFPVAIPFGIALGSFLSADWALMADTVPTEQAGRFLGLSNTATAGAAVLAVAVAGPVADATNRISFGLGFRAIFLLAAIEFVVGAWCIGHVPEPHGADDEAMERSPDDSRERAGS
jgi:MFS family permease